MNTGSSPASFPMTTGFQRYQLTAEFFLKGLAAIYFAAFTSWWTQVIGLVGDQGILPVRHVVEHFSALSGWDILWNMPTLCWLSPGDISLHVQCLLGIVFSVLLFFRVVPLLSSVMCWVLYLSMVVAGQKFMSYQWDSLLLETGLLALAVCPLRGWRPSVHRLRSTAPVVFLFRLLLFKLMFLSGIVKLLSRDTLWTSAEALSVHFETQPLPTVIGWYTHQLPSGLLQVLCVIMFFIELVLPFYVFNNRVFRWLGILFLFVLQQQLELPRGILYGMAFAMAGLEVLYLLLPKGNDVARRVGFAGLVLLQVGILLTGNYTFFNLLTIVLCFWMLESRDWLFFSRQRLGPLDEHIAAFPPCFRFRWALLPLFLCVISSTVIILAGTLRMQVEWPQPMKWVFQRTNGIRAVNGYGLFAVMTPSRPEIQIEGTLDGREWRTYVFRYKAGPPNRMPRQAAPHQPRLDWQMWFAALGDVQGNPWFMNFVGRLLQGEPSVIALLEENPFPEGPPRAIRATRFDYRFTDNATKRETGLWYRTALMGPYLPSPVSLRPQP